MKPEKVKMYAVWDERKRDWVRSVFTDAPLLYRTAAEAGAPQHNGRLMDQGQVWEVWMTPVLDVTETAYSTKSGRRPR